ncbi:hypothetical protein FQR65_LT00598 [Abscondita terminalis]|nr:hypothetical protein FQR65_LT00598 [Abscondita terminalis]
MMVLVNLEEWDGRQWSHSISDIYNENNETVYNTRTTNTSYVFDFEFVGCEKYRISVFPGSEEVEGVVDELKISFPKDPNPPNCSRVWNVTERSAMLFCLVNSDEDNLCETTNFEVICKLHDVSSSSIQQSATFSHDKNFTQLKFENLSEFTNYTCESFIKNVTGERFTFQTKEGSSPVIRTVTSMTNTSFIIEWDPPARIPGLLRTYNVTVTEKQPLYFVPDYCNRTALKARGGEVDGSLLQYVVTDLLPCYEYEVFVTGKTIDFGTKSDSKLIQTNGGIPEDPKDVNFTTVENPDQKIQLDVNWNFPCMANGVILSFTIALIGYPNVDYHIGVRKETKVKYANEWASSYNTSFVNLEPAFNYTLTLKSLTKDNLESTGVVIHFNTPGSPPEAPVVQKVANVTSTSFTIEWLEPSRKNGKLDGYYVYIHTERTDGYMLEDCSNELSTDYTAFVDPSQTRFTFDNALSSFNYTVILHASAEGKNGSKVTFYVQTLDSAPEAPVVQKVANVTSTSFTIEWLEPSRKNGKLDGYYVYIHTERTDGYMLEDCSNELSTDYTAFVDPRQTRFTFDNALSSFNYTVILHASAEGKNGSKVTFYVQTLDSEPEEVRNLNFALINRHQEYYRVSVMINFKLPCNLNGKLQYIIIHLNGTRLHKKPHFTTQNFTLALPEYTCQMDLWAEYEYRLTVHVVTQNYIKSTTKILSAPSGVPPLTNYHMQTPIAISPSKAKFNFSKYLFDDSYGDILYYAIIIRQSAYEEKPMFGHWEGNEETWPVITEEPINNEIMQPYALTPKFWNPFKGNNGSEYSLTIQDSTLRPNTYYSIKIRGFTKNGYRDSSELMFKLPEEYDASGLIFGIIFGILGTIIFLITVFFLWRKRKRWATKKESIKPISLNPMPISVKGFPQYYSELSNDEDRLKQEYLLLVSKSNEITSPCLEGISLKNKKKNRYTNVIAYDHSRVKLNDEDEDSDYINASYIKGYSGDVEYIATQGPLQHTVNDFWKMVIQENSSLIVMVAQFVEQNKDKCFKYFPNNHENIELDDGIEIRCCTELDFKSYIVRTLLIQRDLEQWTITHLQYTDWPDFGCPNGTQEMLEFCRLMRDYADKRNSPVILHCSAGIGRTGTLIALDILLQTIDENKDVDIFNAVLNLRKDRKNMVQTEKQYLYIHNCISDAIEQPLPIKEPIYQNVQDIKKEQNGLNVKESQF